MLDNIVYINHKNEKIEFGKNGMFVIGSNLIDVIWNAQKENEQITGFGKKLDSKTVTIAVKGRSKEESMNLKNRIFEVLEKDVVAEKSGKIVAGDYYLKCYAIESKKSEYVRNSNYMIIKLKIIPQYPFWCREITKSFLKGNKVSDKSEETFLFYPFAYPYQYSMQQDAGFLYNDHYAPCDFQLIIYGPCENPAIRINGHLYEVIATLYAGDYLLADSRDNTVFLYKSDGRKMNLFNWRNKDSGLFEKIPAGRSSVTWNTAAFGFDLTVFQERSEPKWIL